MHKKGNKFSSRELIYNKIKTNIFSGDLKPGERLLELELSKQFHVSRTPIREAIRRLESEGLIKVEPLRGATVTKLSVEEVREIFSIRAILESHATELAVHGIGKKEKETLKKFKMLFNKYLKNENYLEWLNTNSQFHLFIAENSKNSNLFRLLKDLRSRVHRYQFIAATSADIIRQYTKEHEGIIAAAIQGDSKLARKNMEKHLSSVQYILTDFLNRFPTM